MIIYIREKARMWQGRDGLHLLKLFGDSLLCRSLNRCRRGRRLGVVNDPRGTPYW